MSGIKLQIYFSPLENIIEFELIIQQKLVDRSLCLNFTRCTLLDFFNTNFAWICTSSKLNSLGNIYFFHLFSLLNLLQNKQMCEKQSCHPSCIKCKIQYFSRDWLDNEEYFDFSVQISLKQWFLSFICTIRLFVILVITPSNFLTLWTE